MVVIKDKDGEVWGWYSPTEKGVVCYEDGDCHKITTNDVIFDRGQHEGKLLSEISDFRYLNYMKKQGGDNGDYFLENCAKLRLLELSK